MLVLKCAFVACALPLVVDAVDLPAKNIPAIDDSTCLVQTKLVANTSRTSGNKCPPSFANYLKTDMEANKAKYNHGYTTCACTGFCPCPIKTRCGNTATFVMGAYMAFYDDCIRDEKPSFDLSIAQPLLGKVTTNDENDACVAKKTNFGKVPTTGMNSYFKTWAQYISHHGKHGVVQVQPIPAGTHYDHTLVIENANGKCTVMMSWVNKFSLYTWMTGNADGAWNLNKDAISQAAKTKLDEVQKQVGMGNAGDCETMDVVKLFHELIPASAKNVTTTPTSQWQLTFYPIMSR